jgi:GT2 family glycosyltransferase
MTATITDPHTDGAPAYSRRSLPDVSVIVVSYNTRDLLRRCLASVARGAARLSVEIIVIDNASADGSAAMVTREFPSVSLIASAVNLGFAAANNLGFARARGRHLLLLNPDAVPAPGALARSVQLMDADPRIGVGGGRLVGADGSAQPSARTFPGLLTEVFTFTGLSARYPRSRLFGRLDRTWADPSRPADVDWVPGAYAIIRRSALDAVGGFDERFFLYYEEVDLCRRMKAAGFAVRYWPDVVIMHHGGASARTVQGLALTSSGTQLALWRMRSQLLYYRKHHGALAARAVHALESAWHGLRARRHTRGTGTTAWTKAAESAAVGALLAQAWRDTRGGRLAPPVPW